MNDPDDGERAPRVRNPRLAAIAWATFLDTLAETGNVVVAARAAGISRGAVYHRHRRDPKFAGQWRAALMAGYDRLEAAMIRHALGEPFEPVVTGGDAPAGRLDVDLAMKLLARHHATVDHGARVNQAKVARADRGAAGKTLVMKLKAYERRLAAGGGAE